MTRPVHHQLPTVMQR